MFYYLWTTVKYLRAVCATIIRSNSPDHKLVRVLRISDGVDITAEMMSALACIGEMHPAEGAKISYMYKGFGPYAYYWDDIPQYPPPPPPSSLMNSMETQIILAEQSDGTDITEDVIALAGPDGTFHGVADLTLIFASGRTQII